MISGCHDARRLGILDEGREEYRRHVIGGPGQGVVVAAVGNHGRGPDMAIATEYKLGEETIHEVLSNERRKRALEMLKDQRGAADLRSLAEWIATAETGKSPPPKNIRQSVYNSLHQTHLPKLDQLDIIDYDRNRKEVRLRPEARTVDLYMEVVTPYGITWSTYYRTLGMLALVTIVVLELYPFMFPDGATVLTASLFLFVIAASTAYQLWSNQWIQLKGIVNR